MKYLPALLPLLMVACTYEPEEIYFKEVPQPEHAATFSLNSYNDSDTIVLYGPADFSFHVDITPGRVQQVEVLLGDNLIMNSGSKANKFSIDGYRLVTGIYELKIQFISNSGSGSSKLLLSAVGLAFACL